MSCVRCFRTITNATFLPARNHAREGRRGAGGVWADEGSYLARRESLPLPQPTSERRDGLVKRVTGDSRSHLASQVPRAATSPAVHGVLARFFFVFFSVVSYQFCFRTDHSYISASVGIPFISLLSQAS